MISWLVCYDARNTGHPEFHATRYGARRVVEAETREDAEARARVCEGEDWTLTFTTVRPARPAEIERQHLIEQWLTLCRTGQAGRWMGL